MYYLKKNNWSSIVSSWKKSMTGMQLNWVQLPVALNKLSFQG